MSQKKTKPHAKSVKAEQKIESVATESSIRNSPATRALRFLLGKEPYGVNEQEQENLVSTSNEPTNIVSSTVTNTAPNQNTSSSSSSQITSLIPNAISSPISSVISNQAPSVIPTAITAISNLEDQKASDLASIEALRSGSEINEIPAIASASRASSILDSSESQLSQTSFNNEKPTQSQLSQSQLILSQLSPSQLEKIPLFPEPNNKLQQPEIDDPIIEIPLPSRSTPLGKREASSISVNWRSVEHTRIPQVVFDEILPQLPPMAQTPYLQLLRLTLGFQRDSCHISLESWAARCNQSLASIKRQALFLQQRGLLKKESVVFGGTARGSYFCPVIPGILNDDSIKDSQALALEKSKEKQSQLTQSQLSSSQLTQSQLPVTYMKSDHDHDLRNKIDHHERQVMMTYQELTGNRPTLADLSSYQRIAYLGAEEILANMQQIYDRSSEPIGSFAYFAKALVKASQEQYRNRNVQKRNLEKIVERIRQSRIGSRASLSDLIEEIKRACVRDNVNYNNDLVNEILGL